MDAQSKLDGVDPVDKKNPPTTKLNTNNYT